MTPKSIETGRKLAASSTLVAAGDDATTLIATADAARVACSIALSANWYEAPANMLVIGTKVSGVLVPLTVLNIHHPACYLSVDKIGTLVVQELWCYNSGASPCNLGVSIIRQTQALEDK